jgi:hypothetical protein
MRDEVTSSVTQHIIDKLKAPVEDSQRQIEKFTANILRRIGESEAQLEEQKTHRLDGGFLSITREEHTAEILGHKITVLTENNEELKNERDDLEKANISAQKLVTKLKEEKTLWQNKFLNLLEGNKRPREENAETSGSKRRADPKSEHYHEVKSASTLEEISSSKSGRATNKSPRNTLENGSSHSRATTSRRHTSTSAHTDRTQSLIIHTYHALLRWMSEERGQYEPNLTWTLIHGTLRYLVGGKDV